MAVDDEVLEDEPAARPDELVGAAAWRTGAIGLWLWKLRKLNGPDFTWPHADVRQCAARVGDGPPGQDLCEANRYASRRAANCWPRFVRASGVSSARTPATCPRGDGGGGAGTRRLSGVDSTPRECEQASTGCSCAQSAASSPDPIQLLVNRFGPSLKEGTPYGTSRAIVGAADLAGSCQRRRLVHFGFQHERQDAGCAHGGAGASRGRAAGPRSGRAAGFGQGRGGRGSIGNDATDFAPTTPYLPRTPRRKRRDSACPPATGWNWSHPTPTSSARASSSSTATAGCTCRN